MVLYNEFLGSLARVHSLTPHSHASSLIHLHKYLYKVNMLQMKQYFILYVATLELTIFFHTIILTPHQVPLQTTDVY